MGNFWPSGGQKHWKGGVSRAQLTNKAFTDASKGRIRQSLTALVLDAVYFLLFIYIYVLPATPVALLQTPHSFSATDAILESMNAGST